MGKMGPYLQLNCTYQCRQVINMHTFFRLSNSCSYEYSKRVNNRGWFTAHGVDFLYPIRIRVNVRRGII